MTTTLHVRQGAPHDGYYPIRLTLKRPGKIDQEAETKIQFTLSEQEQEDLRWYLEDYLQRADTVEAVTVQQIERLMRERGEELYQKVLAVDGNTQALWFSIRNEIADLRIEIASGVAEAASIPWELMRDPQLNSPISLRAKAFVRVQSNPNISFVSVPPASDGRIRLLYVVCRPGGAHDVELRAVANRLLQDLGTDRPRFDIKALRPPTFEQLQQELIDAKEAGRPYHIVHFDGHGAYEDLSETTLAEWAKALSNLVLGGAKSGKHGYLLFEHAGEQKMRPVDGHTLGKLLHDNGVPVLVLNACQSAMHEAVAAPKSAVDVHNEVRAIGSLAQAVIDQGIPAVLGMRYSVYVVTAAQYIGRLYAALAKNRSFGQAATEGRKHLEQNPERWVGLQPRPLQDWFVPVVYEAAPIELFSAQQPPALGKQPELDPVQRNHALLRYVPEEGFIGRDETLLAVDRAFDNHRVVLLHAYAGQGKTSTAVEFARWYSITGGLGAQPLMLFASFEGHTNLDKLLDQLGRPFAQSLEARDIHWSAVNDRAERRQLVLQLLRAVPTLWIWDNVEPVAGFPEGMESQWTPDEQAELRDFLKQIKLDGASQVRILLTSRRDEQKWLGGIPHRIAMSQMRNSDAAKLALKLGQENRIQQSEIADWQPLLDYCAGNPLTLRVLVGQAVKAGLHGRASIEKFVEEIRSGEQRIDDADENQGRDKSLGASLDYGFRHAFREDELPIVALLHLFQEMINIQVLQVMGEVDEHPLSELRGKTKEELIGLLNRAKEIGLLTPIGLEYYAIHPALPWFLRQLFVRHYYGESGHSTTHTATKAWVFAVSRLGAFFQRSFQEGSRNVIELLEWEEANLLHARRLARQNELWTSLIMCMHGLNVLYDYQGRIAEWSRLVDEIQSDFCSADHDPIAGREDQYTFVMEFLVNRARHYDHNLNVAGMLQAKCVEFDRSQATSVLAFPVDVPLDDRQRHLLSTLGTSVFTLGQILREKGDAECVQYYQQSILLARRIANTTLEVVAEFNLGHAYKDLPAICNLDSAEACYQRTLAAVAPNDSLGLSRCLQQIGMVHHQRFVAARNRTDSSESMRHHANEAAQYYYKALRLLPKGAVVELGTIQGQMGELYKDIGQFDQSLEHFEQATQYFSKTGDRYRAGATRYNIAVVYRLISMMESQKSQARDMLERAQAYAEAALRDFQHFQGRTCDMEEETKLLIDRIKLALTQGG